MRLHPPCGATALLLGTFLAPAAAASGSPPVCDPGGPYLAECGGPMTAIPLDGSRTHDPEGDFLWVFWNEGSPFAYIDDPTSLTPNLWIDMVGVGERVCALRLSATAGGETTRCGTWATARDTEAPRLWCPPDVVLPPGSAFGPDVAGSATAWDRCQPDALTSWDDLVWPGADGGIGVRRLWSARDAGQGRSCEQVVTVRGPLPEPLHLDLRPGIWPNRIDVRAGGVLPVLLILPPGLDAAAFEEEADLALSRFDGAGSPVEPLSMQVIDLAGRPEGGACAGAASPPDGILDLHLHFSVRDLALALELGDLPHGTQIELLLAASAGGLSVGALDCAIILNP